MKAMGYRDIQNILLQRINARVWPEGSLIPSEEQLAREFGCTRVTVGRAVQALASLGLVERKPRKGTQVCRKKVRQALIRIPVVRDEIERLGGTYGYLCLERREAVPPPEVRMKLELKASDKALHILALHYSGSEPYQLENRWINLESVPEAGKEHFEESGPGEWLGQRMPFPRAEHQLQAELADEQISQALKLEEKAALFVIQRTTWFEDRPITFVRLIHPGRRFVMTTREPYFPLVRSHDE